MAGFGDFAGGFAGGFAQMLQMKQENARRDKMAKLQGQLLELQLKGEQQKQDATGILSELSTGTLGPINIGETQTVDGRKQTPLDFTGKAPMSLTEILADPEGQMAALQSGILNLGDLVQKPGQEPADLQMLKAAGIDPQSEEGRAAILSSVGGSGSDALMQGLQAQIEMFKLEELRRTRQVEETTEVKRVKNTKVAIRNDFHHAQEIVQLQRELEQTALQSGVPYGDFLRNLQAGGAAVAQALGFDVTRTKELLEKRDRLNKLFADGVIESIDRFAESGTLTNDKFNALQKATPNMNNSPGANALLLADRMEAALDSADIEEIEVIGREEIEAFIELARNQPGANQGEAVVDVPGVAAAAADAGRAVVAEAKDIARMSLEQLQKLDLRGLSQEAIDAAEKRWNELNAGR